MEKDIGARARITMKVQPRAKVTRVAGRMGHAYRLQLAAPPLDGKANEECVAFLAGMAGRGEIASSNCFGVDKPDESSGD